MSPAERVLGLSPISLRCRVIPASSPHSSLPNSLRNIGPVRTSSPMTGDTPSSVMASPTIPTAVCVSRLT
jgi:hypothetical protein